MPAIETGVAGVGQSVAGAHGDPVTATGKCKYTLARFRLLTAGGRRAYGYPMSTRYKVTVQVKKNAEAEDIVKIVEADSKDAAAEKALALVRETRQDLSGFNVWVSSVEKMW